MKLFHLLLCCFLICIKSFATTYTNTAGLALDLPGSWRDGGGVAAGGFTNTGDVFNLANTPAVTSLSASWTLGIVSLNITTAVNFRGGVPMILNGTTLSSSASLTFLTAGTTLTIGDGINATSLVMTAGNLSFLTAANTMTIALLGTVDMQGAASNLVYSATNIGVYGTFRTAGTSATPVPASKDFSAGGLAGGLVQFYSGSDQTIPTGTYPNLTTSGGGIKANGTITINNDLTIGGATTLSLGASVISAAGNWTNSGSLLAGTGAVVFTGAGTHALAGPMTGTNKFYDLTFNNAAGTWNINAAADVADNFTITNGAVNAPAGTLQVAGNFAHGGGTFNANGGIVNLNGSAAQTLPGISATTFNTLTVDNTFSRTLTSTGAVITGSSFTIPSGISWNTVTYAITVNGDWGNNGSYTSAGGGLNILGNYSNASGVFNAGTGTVSMTGSSTYTLTGAMTGANKFNNLTFNNAAATWSMNAGVDVGGNFTLLTGILNAPATVLQVGGNFAHTAGTFNTNGGTVTLNGTGTQQLPGATTTTFNILTIDNSSPRTLTLNGDVVMSTAFTLPSGIVWNATSRFITALGNFTNSGTYVMTTGGMSLNGNYDNTSGTLTAGSSTITFNGTGAHSLSGAMSGASKFNHITFNNAAGSWSFNATAEAGGHFTMTNGDVTAPATILSVGGNFAHSAGAFNTNGGTVNMNGTTAQVLPGSVATTFNILTIDNTTPRTLTCNGDITSNTAFTLPSGISWSATSRIFTANGNFTNNGTFVLSTGSIILMANYDNTSGTLTSGTGTISFLGTGTYTLSGAMTGINKFNHLTFNNAASTWSFGASADVGGNFTITDGIVNAPTTTLKVGGNFAHTAGTFNTNSGTVNLNGTGPQLLPGVLATTFNTLSIDNATSRTLTSNNDVVISNAFSLPSGITWSITSRTFTANSNFSNSGTFTISSGALNLLGNYDNTSGTFTGGTGNVNLTGTGAHTLTGNMTGSSKFNNLTFNNATGSWTMNASADAGGNFNLTNGTLVAPAGTLKVGGNFIRAAAGTFTHNNGTVDMGGTLAQAFPTTATTFYNLKVSNATLAVTANTAVTINDSLITVAAANLDMAANLLSGAFDATGNSGTVKTKAAATAVPAAKTWGGTVLFNLTTAAQAVMQGAYNNLSLTGQAFAKTTGAGSTTVAGNLSVSETTGITKLGGAMAVKGNVLLTGTTAASIFDVSLSNYQVNCGGNWTTTSTTATNLFNSRLGTVIFDGTGPQTISTVSGSVLPSFYNVTLTNSVNPLVVNTSTNIGAALSVGANAVVSPAATVVINPGVIGLSVSGSGTLQVSRIAATADYPTQYNFLVNTPSALTVDYSGAGAQNVNSYTYGTLKTSGSGTKTAQGDLTVNTGLNIGAGTVLDMGNLHRLVAGTAPSYTVSGILMTAMPSILTTIPVPTGVSWNGTGTVEYSATGGSQTIVPGTYYNLTMDNTSVTNAMTGTVTVNGALAAGKLTLGSNNLILGTAATVSVASATQYVIATGSGHVRKSFGANGSFAYPVGDITNYTPITLNMTAGAYAAAYAEVNVTAARQPNDLSPANYLLRYWSVGLSGITSPVYSATATYVAGDVHGSEAAITGAAYTAGLWYKFLPANTVNKTVASSGLSGTTAAITGTDGTAPTVSVLPAAPTRCAGTLALLTASGTGSPALSYTWAPATGLSATSGATVNATPAATTTYTVTVTDGNNVTGFSTVTVSVNAVPAAITGANSIYTGATTTLSDATPSGVWSNGTTLVTTINSSGLVTGLIAGTSVITYTTPNSCAATLQMTVNIITLTTWNGSTWSGGSPAAGVDVVIASTITPTPGIFTANNLTINSGMWLNTGTNAAITINGDLIDNGLGFTGTGTVNFAKAGTVSIGAGGISFAGVITVGTGCTLATNGLLTLLSGAAYNGSIGSSAGTITGNVAVQRYNTAKRAFRFYGHPFSGNIALSQITGVIDITGGTVADGFAHTTTGNPSAFWFDASAADTVTTGNNSGWVAFTAPLTTANWPQYGLLRLLVRGNTGEGLTTGAYTPSATVFSMTGQVNQGTQTITLNKGVNSQYVSCGNPYPSGVQMNTVTKGANIGANYSIWDPAQGTRGAYITNPFSMSYILPSFSAITTTATANTLNTITFHEIDKVGTVTLLSKTTTAAPWLELLLADSTNKWDRLLIKLDSSADAGQDADDAVKLSNPDIDFYTLSADNKRLAVDVRPYSKGGVIALGLKAAELYGKYVIRTGSLANVAGRNKLYLHDKYLGTATELAAGFEYWFDVTADAASQGEQRFAIGMSDTADIKVSSAVTMELYPNPAHNSLQLSYSNMKGIGQIALTDVTGRVVYKTIAAAGSGSITIALQYLPSGMYMVQLQGSNAVLIKKLIKN